MSKSETLERRLEAVRDSCECMSEPPYTACRNCRTVARAIHAVRQLDAIKRRQVRATKAPLITITTLTWDEGKHNPVCGGVYRHPEQGVIFVTSGSYQSLGRISNFFYWRLVKPDGSLGREKCGYGGRWPMATNASTAHTISIEG